LDASTEPSAAPAPTKIKAKYEGGVLKLSIPKKEEAKPKEIPVNVE